MTSLCWFLSGGKRDEDLILPINDSLSVTLSSEQVRIAYFSKLNLFYNGESTVLVLCLY